MGRKNFVLGLSVAFLMAATAGAFLIPKKGAEVVLPTMKHGDTVVAPKKQGSSIAGQIELYEDLVRKDPDNIEHRLRLGGLLARRGQWDRARGQFARAVELDPGNAQLRIRLAVTYWHGGDTDKGLEQLDEALKADPSLASAHFYKGILLSSVAGRKAEAVAELHKVIELAPDSPIARQARRHLTQFRASQIPSFLPRALGGLMLKEHSSGKEAIAEINKMHDKDLAITRGYVASYADGKSEKSARLWISESKDPDGLLDQMVRRIKAGNTPFSVPVEVEGLGAKVYSSEGMDQTHYIWATGELLIWLSLKAFPAENGLEILKDAVRTIKNPGPKDPALISSP